MIYCKKQTDSFFVINSSTCWNVGRHKNFAIMKAGGDLPRVIDEFSGALILKSRRIELFQMMLNQREIVSNGS